MNDEKFARLRLETKVAQRDEELWEKLDSLDGKVLEDFLLHLTPSAMRTLGDYLREVTKELEIANELVLAPAGNILVAAVGMGFVAGLLFAESGYKLPLEET